VIAETDPHNFRMLEAFRNRGFDSEVRSEEEVVLLERWVSRRSPHPPVAAHSEP
jgi:hypothetical protein